MCPPRVDIGLNDLPKAAPLATHLRQPIIIVLDNYNEGNKNPINLPNWKEENK